MTTLRNDLLRILRETVIFQLVSITQRHASRKCHDNKAMHLGLDSFWDINQSVKEYRNAPNKTLYGGPDNNYYEANRPHNQTVRRTG